MKILFLFLEDFLLPLEHIFFQSLVVEIEGEEKVEGFNSTMVTKEERVGEEEKVSLERWKILGAGRVIPLAYTT